MTDSDDALDEVFADWYERRERGDAEAPDELTRRHPELADPLERQMAALELIDQVLDGGSADADVPARIGPYRVLDVVGAGGMGTVYRARALKKTSRLAADEEVALKVLHRHLLARPGFFKRFLREAELGQRIECEQVVRTLDADAILHDGQTIHFLVMEFVRGQTLRDLLEELDRVPEALCRHIAREVAIALEAIHEAGAVHRDLKPENVLITPDQRIRVMDFGVARLHEEAARISQTGAFVGSLHYAAPEQLGSADALDHRADLHALGVLLYELASGSNPFHAPDARASIARVVELAPPRLGSANPQISPFLEEVVHTLLAKDPSERFSSAATLGAVLAEGEAGDWWMRHTQELAERTHEPLRRVRVPRETPVFGRQAELAVLADVFAQAQGGSGQVVLIEGEAGIGKSRLLDAFIQQIHDAGGEADCLYGAYPPGGAATALDAFTTALREHFGTSRLDEELERRLPDTPGLVAPLAALLRGEAPPAGVEPLSKDALQTVFSRLVRGLAAERTVVLLIDDLHFCGPEGRALFAALVHAISDSRVVLLGTMRRRVPSAWASEIERQSHARRLALSRLGPKDLMRMLESTFRSQRLARELGHQIALKSDGNPLFVFEIVRGLREGGYVTALEDGSWISTGTLADIDVPSSVLDMIQARLAELDEEDKELLDVAACCGFEFDPLLVAGALDLGQIPVMRRLARIEKRHGLVRAMGRGYVFDHHQVQEALYESLPPLLREPYHEAIGTVLEAQVASRAGADGALEGRAAVRLCEHFLRGRAGRRAIRYLDAALDALGTAHEPLRAARIAHDALETEGLLTGTARLDVLLRRAGLLGTLGHAEDAGATLDEALALARTLGDQDREGRTWYTRAVHAYMVGRYEEALEAADEALALARDRANTELEMRVHGNRGSVLVQLGRYEEATRELERQMELGLLLGEPRFVARAAGDLGTVLWHLGRYESARTRLMEASRAAAEFGDPLEQARAAGNLGNVLWRLGHHEEAYAQQERARALAHAIGNRRGEAMATGNLGNTLSALGRYEEARLLHEQNARLAEEIGDAGGATTARFNAGMELLRLGDVDGAEQAIEAALTRAARIGLRFLLPHGEIARAEILSRTAATKAKAHLERAIALASEQGAWDLVVEAQVELGELEARTGRHEAARATLEAALAQACDVGNRPSEVIARCRLAELPGGVVADAVDAFERHASLLDHAQRRTARLLLWQATGERFHLEAARRLLDEAQAHAPEGRRRAMEEQVAVNRAIAEQAAKHL